MSRALRAFAVCSTLLMPALLSAQSTAAQGAADPRVAALVAGVSQERLQAIVTKLAGFGTRSTLSDTVSATRGIGAARRWIHDQFRSYSPKLQVSYDRYPVAQHGRITRDLELVNVVAVLPGRRTAPGVHHGALRHGESAWHRRRRGERRRGRPRGGWRRTDAPEMNHNADAPGANDDGSGTALTMELARVFATSGVDFDATLVFVTWAGEEQGLVGSMAHAQRIAAAKTEVTANFNNDIVGSSLGGNGIIDAESVRIYSLGPEDSMHRSLARYIPAWPACTCPRTPFASWRAKTASGAAAITPASPRSTSRGGVPRGQRELQPPAQHRGQAGGMDFRYLAQNTRVNAAAAASLALAPPAPQVTTDRGTPTLSRGTYRLRCDAAVAGVTRRGRLSRVLAEHVEQRLGEVAVRGQHHALHLSNVSIDDYVFGVAAVNADGHESLVSAYVSPNRRMQEVQVKK
jgi:hypothetical protein